MESSWIRYVASVAMGPLLWVPLTSAAHAQLSGRSVGQDSSVLSDVSTNVGAVSGPVQEPNGSVRELNAGRLGSATVRESATGTMLSGPVSEISAGALTDREAAAAIAMMGSSAGVAAPDLADVAGESAIEPVLDVGQLQEQLRGLQPLGPAPEPAPEPVDGDAAASPEGADSADATDGGHRLAYTDDQATEGLDLENQQWFGQRAQPGAAEVDQPPPPQVDEVQPDYNAPARELGEDTIQAPPPVQVPRPLE